MTPDTLAQLRNKYPGLEIVQGPIPGCLDSFWYDGTVATYKGYTLIAAGDIAFAPTFDNSPQADWDDIASMAKNDAGLAALVCNEGETRANYYWVNNNWFEVILPNGDCVLGDVQYDYESGIAMLVEYAKQQV